MDNRRFGTVPSSHLRGIGLDLMAAIPAPDDEANGRHQRRCRATSAGRATDFIGWSATAAVTGPSPRCEDRDDAECPHRKKGLVCCW